MDVLGPQRLDTSRLYRLTLTDADGEPADLSGASALAVVLAPGPGAEAVATLEATAVSPAPAGLVDVWAKADTLEGLAPGRYRVFATATSGGQPIDLAADYAIDLVGGVGTEGADAAYTIADLEREVVNRCHNLLRLVGIDETTGGANPALAGPIRRAMGLAGVAVANPRRPSDSDLADIDASAYDLIADFAHLHALELVLDNWDRPDEQDLMVRQDWGKRGDALQKRVDGLRAELQGRYGLDGQGLSAGTIDLGFATGGEWCP